MTGVTFAADSLSALRKDLFASAPNEGAALLLAGYAEVDGRTRLLVRESFVVPQEGYVRQEPMCISISPTFIAPLLRRARRDGLSLILSHTHPFANEAHFSSVDDEGERQLFPVLFSRAGGRPHGSLLLAAQDCKARIWTREGTEPRGFAPVSEVGRDLKIYDSNRPNVFPTSGVFDRSIRAFGEEGQAALASLCVGIVGLGGLGSIVAEQLAHLGVGEFLLLDPDTVEQSNLNRVVGSTATDLGRPKVEAASDMIRRINPNARVAAVRGDVLNVSDSRKLICCDFVLSCTDTHGSRAVVNQIAYQFLTPAIDMGVRIAAKGEKTQVMAGRVQMLAPGLPCLVCQNLLDPEEVRRDLLSEKARSQDQYIVGAAVPQPAVISLNGAVASLGVTMMLSAVVGLPVAARHQLMLFNRGVVRAASSDPVHECIVCSLRGSLARGDSAPMFSRPN